MKLVTKLSGLGPLLLAVVAASEGDSIVPSPGLAPPPVSISPLEIILNAGVPFQVARAQGNSLCIADGGTSAPTDAKFELQPCDGDLSRDTFVYDPQNRRFQSLSKPELCWSFGLETMQLQPCEPLDEQQFVFTPLPWGDGIGVLQSVAHPDLATSATAERSATNT
ncbi:hypothetical protein Poli38472_001837 [Pythium oligandrum]|uniref:Ricin B lectin domain-containing protein n=1 Tax=Pythium oligandrum TaxID=41045 RepID=A0A8K1CTP3_PYTOL|nr:hypothetical protein Poli38472_001837 [Pythium oligandrum]|eukprot:TMW69681.1 hypothetical protein Poli38472_001837 [Pythium oligandrum]